jgi:hypothetical protein
MRCLDDLVVWFEEKEDSFYKGFSHSFDSVRKNLVKVICAGWLHSSKTFHHYENWTSPSSKLENTSKDTVEQKGAESTPVMKIFSKMSSILIRSISQMSIANNQNIKVDASSNSEPKEKIDFVEIAVKALFESQYNILDGFQSLMTEFYNPEFDSDISLPEYVPPIHNTMLKSIFPEHVDPFGIFVPLEIRSSFSYTKEKPLQIWKIDIRALVIITNISFLLKSMAPKLIQNFEEKFNISLTKQKNVFHFKFRILLLLGNIYIKFCFQIIVRENVQKSKVMLSMEYFMLE